MVEIYKWYSKVRMIPKLMSDTNKLQIQEAQRIPSKINTPMTPKHIIYKQQKVKDKEKLLKEVRSEKI